jgi:low temperature requirement protein LtrA
MVSALAMAPIVMMSIVAMPLPAMAATAAGGGAIPSALWSYGHLLALLGMMGTVVAQKLLVQPGTMTKDDESAVGMLNIAYSLALALLLTSGYFRVAEVGSYEAVRVALAVPYCWTCASHSNFS